MESPFSIARGEKTCWMSASSDRSEVDSRCSSSFSGLDFGEVENVVDQIEQRAAAGRDGREIRAGARIGDQGIEQIGEPENRVHRRADFVAHVGEELALGPIGLVRRVARLAQARLPPPCVQKCPR